MCVIPARLRHSLFLATLVAAGTTLPSARAAAQPVTPIQLSGAESFAVLAKTAVSNTGTTTIGGDVGVGVGGTITGLPPAMLTGASTLHTGDAVAVQALQDARAAWAALAARTCPGANANPVLDGASLASGVYCFNGDAVLTTTLTLTGVGPWIFQVDGGLTIAPGASIVAPLVGNNTCRGSDVYWQVGDARPDTPPTTASIGAAASVVGNIVAEGNVTFGAASTLDGRAFSLGAPTGVVGGSVDLNADTAFAACSFGRPLPTGTAFKVTGGGSINVPSNPAVTDPDATGSGVANYGFNGRPGAPARGNFNYVNHAVAGNLHINGPVTDVAVVALNPDGTAKTARLSGTCDRFLPSCTFSLLTEDNGEPPVNDRFGITIVSNGQVVEARSLRVIRNGNIQFHSATLSTTLNAPTLRHGQTMRVAARLRKDKTATESDAYLVLQLPGGQLLSWTQAGLVPGLVPLLRNFVPVDFDGEVLALPIPAGAPPGVYRWLSALTEAGTLNLLSGLSERTVQIIP